MNGILVVLLIIGIYYCWRYILWFIIIVAIILCISYIYIIIKNKEEKEKYLIEQKKIEEIQMQEEKARIQKENERMIEIQNHINKCKKDFNNILNNINNIEIKLKDVTSYKKQNLKEMPEYSFSTIRKNSKYKDFSNFIAIDVETTGLRPKTDDIIEISAIKFIDNEPIEYMSTLINPKKEIPDYITKINNITNEMVKNAPMISNTIDSFSEFISGFNIVGYNLEFDLNFLYVNNLKLFEEKRKFYDLLPICRKHISKNYVENYKLDTICKFYDIYRNDAHRSTSDALATGLLFTDITEEIKNNIYE